MTRTSPAPNYKHDARRSRAGRNGKVYGYDNCQTPPYALDPLWQYLPREARLWESAAGVDRLLYRALAERGYNVYPSDLLSGYDFFTFEPVAWDIQLTNPPWSKTYKWLKRSYELDRPFALLLKVEVLGAKTAQRLFDKHGVEVIFLDQRIDFKMPVLGWEGKGAQFPVAWFTWGLDIGAEITYGHIVNKPPRNGRGEK